jgi:acyl-CoA thioester hydrolase
MRQTDLDQCGKSPHAGRQRTTESIGSKQTRGSRVKDAVTAPFGQCRDRVRSEWIDENQHMNLGYYVVAFDWATDMWFDHMGFDETHRQTHGVTSFALECHVCHLRELRVGDPILYTTQLLDFDEKRFHFSHRMWHEEGGYLTATNEIINLHVDWTTRKATPMAPFASASIRWKRP